MTNEPQVDPVDAEAAALAADLEVAISADSAHRSDGPTLATQPGAVQRDESAPVHDAAPDPSPLRPSPGARRVEPPRPPPPRSRRPARKVSQVADSQDMVRIYRVNEIGQEQPVGDYSVREIAAGGGDIEGFCWHVLAPKYAGGRYNIYEHTKTGLRLLQTVSTPDPTQQPRASGAGGIPPWGAPQGPVEQLQAIAQLSREERIAAERRAAEEAQREQARWDRIEALMAKASSGDGLMPLLMLQMLRPANPGGGAAPGSATVQAIEALARTMERQTQDMQMAMHAASMPPPPPPPPPPPDPMETMLKLQAMRPSAADTATAIATALGPILGPIASALTRARPEPTETVAALTTTVSNAISGLAAAGVIGGPKTTPTDVGLAELRAKLDAMQQGGTSASEETLHLFQAFAGFLEQLRPRDSARDWIAVVDRAIDRGPEIVQSFGALAAQRQLLVGPAAKAQPSGTVPAALVALRRDILAIDLDAVETVAAADGSQVQRQMGQIHVIQTAVPALAQVYRAGGAWKALVERLYRAAAQEDVEGVKRCLAELVLRAWGRDDPRGREFYRRLAAAWTAYVSDIAVALLGGERQPAPAEQPDVAMGVEEAGADQDPAGDAADFAAELDEDAPANEPEEAGEAGPEGDSGPAGA